MNDKETDLQDVLNDIQKVTSQANRVKDKIIVVLIVLLVIQTMTSVSSNTYYEKKISNITATQTVDRCAA